MGLFSFLFRPKAPVARTSSVLACPHSAEYVILDTETTGLNPSSDKIIQLSAIKYNSSGTPIDFYNTYLNPGFPIPTKASRINGITDKMVAHAPSAQEIQNTFFSFLGNALIVGYNVTFDLRFLYHTFGDFFSDRQYVDVLSIARQLLWCPNYKLETVCYSVGFSPSSSFHDSFVDCEAVAAILNHIEEDLRPWSRRFQAQDSYGDTYYTVPKGYDDWLRGEEARIKGDFENALSLFSKAQDLGFMEPIIFESYAKLYRKQKDYENEISILEDAITRFDGSTAKDFEIRKKKAQDLLLAKQKKEMELQQKSLKRAQKEEEKRNQEAQERLKPKQTCKRSVIQYSDDGTIIKIYESISAAATEVGVSSKGIREAASGRQKHAGGFCWEYAASDDPNTQNS